MLKEVFRMHQHRWSRLTSLLLMYVSLSSCGSEKRPREQTSCINFCATTFNKSITTEGVTKVRRVSSEVSVLMCSMCSMCWCVDVLMCSMWCIWCVGVCMLICWSGDLVTIKNLFLPNINCQVLLPEQYSKVFPFTSWVSYFCGV
jgi:hypothetical protein